MSVEIEIGSIKVGNNNPLFLIAGPCVIENEQECFQIAQRLIEITSKLQIPLIFKASYDKANRSSINSYRGPGLREGLRILRLIKQELNLPILTDVHCCNDMSSVAEVADVLQIPAFLCRQTDLILEAAKTGKIINVKKGQFLAPEDMKNVIDKIISTGNRNILLTERGVSFGYHNLVVDFRAIPIMKSLGFPVIFDATHSVQLPSGGGAMSSGQKEFVAPLSKAAVSVGCDGLFLEVHHQPERSLSDGPNMISLDELPDILTEIKSISYVVRNNYECYYE